MEMEGKGSGGRKEESKRKGAKRMGRGHNREKWEKRRGGRKLRLL